MNFHTSQQILPSTLIWMKAALHQEEHSRALARVGPSLFALIGRDLQIIMGHVGRRHPSIATASYYMQLSKVMSANCPSPTLTGQDVNIVAPGDLYQNCNTLRKFLPAFLR